MDNQYYDLFFGTKTTESIYPSTEHKEIESKWVLYRFNSVSSIAYITNAIIILYFTNSFYLINYLGSFISLFLGIASFFWWASQRDLIQRIDIALYSSLIFWPGTIKLCQDNEDIEFTITSIYFVLTGFLLYIFYDNEINVTCLKCNGYSISINKNNITFLNLIGIIFSMYNIISIEIHKWLYMKIIIIFLTVLGFVLKLSDTYKILPSKICGSGTGWFHLFTALTLLFSWYLLQNINSHTNLPIDNTLNNIIVL